MTRFEAPARVLTSVELAEVVAVWEALGGAWPLHRPPETADEALAAEMDGYLAGVVSSRGVISTSGMELMLTFTRTEVTSDVIRHLQARLERVLLPPGSSQRQCPPPR